MRFLPFPSNLNTKLWGTHKLSKPEGMQRHESVTNWFLPYDKSDPTLRLLQQLQFSADITADGNQITKDSDIPQFLKSLGSEWRHTSVSIVSNERLWVCKTTRKWKLFTGRLWGLENSFDLMHSIYIPIMWNNIDTWNSQHVWCAHEWFESKKYTPFNLCLLN